MSAENSSASAGAAEIDALTAIVRVLQPLPAETRQRVVESALILLGSKRSAPDHTEIATVAKRETPPAALHQPTDIRSLKTHKNPASANEMTALVAYYLAEVAVPDERKAAIEIADVEKYFKQANFRLPRTLKMTLVHAKNAGYFDAVGEGKYKLNPVGYNLVVHSLPRSGSTDRVGARSRTRRHGAGSSRRRHGKPDQAKRRR